MPLKLPRRIFAVSAVICVILRIYLHIAFIDPATGFYSGGTAAAVVYYVILTAAVVSVFILGLRAGLETPRIAVSIPLRVSALAASIGTAMLAVPVPAQIQGPAYLPHPAGVIALRLFLLSLAPLVTVVLLIYIAVRSRDRFAHVNGCLMMLPVVWMAGVLLTRFMDYTASRHVSDQMLTVVMLCFATLFFLPLGRLAAGLSPRKTARQMTAFGLPFALLAFSACGGILAGPAAETPLALSRMESVSFLLLGIFAMATVFSIREK